MTETSKISIRNARPEDAQDVARLIVMAWPIEEFLEMTPGLEKESFIDFISGFVASKSNLYSYEYTKVAVVADEEGERVAGMMNGYDGALYEDLKIPIIERFNKHFPDSGNGFRQVHETGPGEFYLDSAGVDPSMRSMGIGSMLFEAMFKEALSQGLHTVGLIVDEDKPKAEALYLRLGFTIVNETDFLGHKMKHMQKTI